MSLLLVSRFVLRLLLVSRFTLYEHGQKLCEIFPFFMKNEIALEQIGK